MKIALLALSLTVLAACAGPRHGSAEKPAASAAPAAAVSAMAEAVAESTYNVVPLQCADARDLSRVLMNAVRRKSEQSIVADERTNSLVVTCTAGEFTAIRELIAALDVPVQKL